MLKSLIFINILLLIFLFHNNYNFKVTILNYKLNLDCLYEYSLFSLL